MASRTRGCGILPRNCGAVSGPSWSGINRFLRSSSTSRPDLVPQLPFDPGTC